MSHFLATVRRRPKTNVKPSSTRNRGTCTSVYRWIEERYVSLVSQQQGFTTRSVVACIFDTRTSCIVRCSVTASCIQNDGQLLRGLEEFATAFQNDRPDAYRSKLRAWRGEATRSSLNRPMNVLTESYLWICWKLGKISTQTWCIRLRGQIHWASRESSDFRASVWCFWNVCASK